MKRRLQLAAFLLALAGCRSAPDRVAREHYVAWFDDDCVVCATPLALEGDHIVLPNLWVSLGEGVVLESLRVIKSGPHQDPVTVFEATDHRGRSAIVIEGFETRWTEGVVLDVTAEHSGSENPARFRLR